VSSEAPLRKGLGGIEEPLHPRPPDPPAPETGRRRSDLPLRLLTAGILVPSVLWIIVLGGLWYLVTVIGIILLGLREFYNLIEEKGAQPLWGFGLAAGAALPIVAYVGNEYHATILMTAALLALMVAQLTKAQIAEALASISGTFFGLFYVGWLLSHAIVLRFFHRVVATKWGADAAESFAPDVGIFYMIFALTCVVLCDAGAYFSGRAYGRHRLMPAVSPGKTVEGLIGGVLAGGLGGVVAKAVFDFFWPLLSEGFGYGVAAGFGVLIAIAGVIGDLVESLLKRDARRKDAGTLLPGMGGVLDRIDSSLIGIPVMYYLLLAYTYVRVG
jgi:phosphatidate cytidylyltransferase